MPLSDQLEPESVLMVSLLAILLFALLPVPWEIRFVAAVVVLLLTIVFGILARQWIVVGIALVPIASVFGYIILVILASLYRTPGGNESAPVANLRTINTAEVTYLSSAGTYGTMEDLIAAKLLDETFTGTKVGYDYSITLDETGSTYTAEAVPAPVVPKRHWWSSSSAAAANERRYGYYSVPDAVVRYWTDASLAPTAAQVGKSVQ